MFLLIFLIAVLLVLYVFVIRTWSYFTIRNVKFVRGLPPLGTLASVVLGRSSFPIETAKVYNKYPNERFVGMYEMGGKISVMIRDPELMKTISTKDFDSFVNHSAQTDNDEDPLMSRILFNAKDQKWRDLRSVMSPLFTGSKMRMMVSLMADSIEACTSYIRKEIIEMNPKDRALEYDMRDVISGCASDVIASCAFGIQTNSLKEKDNEFFQAGKAITYGIQTATTFLTSSFPKLASLFKVKILDKKYDNFFRNVVRNNVQQRKEQNIVRHDMIHLIIMAQQGKLDLKEKEELSDAGFATISEVLSSRAAEKLKDMNEDDFVAQCMLFFVAGFSALAKTMCFLCQELAINPDIQERLHREIYETHVSLNGGQLTYEAIQKMIYLDQVISEVLRKWPSATLLERCVNKEYTLENTDGSKMLLHSNDLIWFPRFAVHHDPKYFPEPEKFDPERFSMENRKSINSAAYIPFGFGPRSCIASRFALMELKACIYHLVRDFYLECSDKTDVSLKLKNGTFSLDADKGFWLQLKVRGDH